MLARSYSQAGAGQRRCPPPTRFINRQERRSVEPMDRIDEIITLVETARNVPMSRNCMLDRGEMIGLLEQLRSEIPMELRRAGALLDERDKILDAGQREAERMISEA